jgi:RimJ/RimL family protein N-acetyltransferase
MIRTERLCLRPWCDTDFDAFAELHADEEVMADLGGPMERSVSDTKLRRYRAAYSEHGISRWAVENAEARFLGYAGVVPRPSREHPLGNHFEIGWRFARHAWGHGYATESARAALVAAFSMGIDEIVSYTSAENFRSQAVMARLKLQRDASRDFIADYGGATPWHGLIWIAGRNTWKS